MPFLSRRGFTLIEIAVVMVIIGLIIAGIFVGRDMIGAATFRNIHKQQEEISSAVKTSRNKYNCMPGDCENATAQYLVNDPTYRDQPTCGLSYVTGW